MVDGPEEEIDLALACYLIVADVPEFQNFTREEYFDRLDKATETVATLMRRYEERSVLLGQSELEDVTAPIFRFGSAMIALGITYNDKFKTQDPTHEEIQRLYGNPDNIFLAGLLRTGKGSCVSMPLLYLVIGQKLGLPVHLVSVGKHFLIRWQGKDFWFNMETTITEKVCITDSNDNYFESESLTPEMIKGTNQLRNLTKREVLGSLLAARSAQWVSRGGGYNKHAYADFRRASFLIPDDPFIKSNEPVWALHIRKAREADAHRAKMAQTLPIGRQPWNTVPVPNPLQKQVRRRQSVLPELPSRDQVQLP